MPSKIQLDENLWFLYICLQKSDYKAIDFNAVGDATKLKPPAARMRYTRLRRAIESGTLIGRHGMPFQSGSEKVVEVQKKRKRLLHSTHTEEVDDPEPLVTHNGGLLVRMEQIEDGSADQYDTGLLIHDKKAPSIREGAWAPKRKVDADKEMAESASALLRSEERKWDSGPTAQSSNPKIEREGGVDSKNTLAVEGKRRITSGNEDQTGTRNHALAPPDIQRPVQAFESWHATGLTLKRETDETVSTDPTTTQTKATPKGKRRETK